MADLEARGGLYGTKPASFRSRLQVMPPVELPHLWPNKVQAIRNLERSLREDRPRALIQMAPGSGKTLLAISVLYRLIKFGGARRVLFLVDRGNLGEQAEKEFANYRTPDDRRKFPELYGVQRLTTNTIGAVSKVVITTIQRLYSMLTGEPELPPEAEEQFPLGSDGLAPQAVVPVAYSPGNPPEYFDVIVVDEANLPDPHVIAQEIAEDLRAALEQIEDIVGDLKAKSKS